MRYAEVAVDAPAGRSTYSYVVPAEVDASPGSLARVPFGPRVTNGIVVDVSASPAHEATRSLLSVSHSIRLTSRQLDVGLFISRSYLCPPYPALALFLPPGASRGSVVAFGLPASADAALPSLSPEEEEVLRSVRQEGRIYLSQLRRGPGAASRVECAEALVERGVLVRLEVFREPLERHHTERLVSLRVGAATPVAPAGGPGRPLGTSQRRALGFLAARNGPVPYAELRRECGVDSAVVAALQRRGLIDVTEKQSSPEVGAPVPAQQAVEPCLTPAQAAAWERMSSHRDDAGFGEFLLFGVTGSGKTELYLRAARRTVELGKQVICLVPEIVLASQTVERFAARFPGRVAVLHSGLTEAQSGDEWHRAGRGECDIVVGARSALFAPLERPGLFILDEEHDWAYKQDDTAPRYHARAVARELARQSGAILLLGSATPDVETFHRTESGLSQLLELPSRVGNSPGLPPVEVVDMRDELKQGNANLFSRALSREMAESLSRREQVLLLLNRRGTAPMVQCRRCGQVVACPRCSVALALHGTRGRLVCHRCGYSSPVPVRCPRCRSDRLRTLGTGTQGVVDEVSAAFPDARVVRWDSDVPARVRGGSSLNDAVLGGDVDVIVGTQMVAKGLDFPGVTLVGVVNADIGLNVPDYRSGERVFQLLCQSAGRAGRGVQPGRVVVQSYQPDNYVIRTAAAHDYRAFYEEEIRYRRGGYFPPFSTVAQLVYSHSDELRCRRESERVRAELARRIGGRAFRLTGPAPAFVRRLRGRYRWQLTVRGPDPAELLSDLVLPSGWAVDIDPAGIA